MGGGGKSGTDRDHAGDRPRQALLGPKERSERPTNSISTAVLLARSSHTRRGEGRGRRRRVAYPEKGSLGVYLPNSRPNTLALVSHRLSIMIDSTAMSACTHQTRQPSVASCESMAPRAWSHERARCEGARASIARQSNVPLGKNVNTTMTPTR